MGNYPILIRSVDISTRKVLHHFFCVYNTHKKCSSKLALNQLAQSKSIMNYRSGMDKIAGVSYEARRYVENVELSKYAGSFSRQKFQPLYR
ncbi:hypothetical protein Plhal304r1_c005g0020431 [Plasmopara halstedii]